MRHLKALAVVGLLGVAVTLAWAAGPTALRVKFKLPPVKNAVKAIAVVDGDGNVLFNTTTPGRVAVTNLPAAVLAPRLPSDVRTVRSTTLCPNGPPSSLVFDQVIGPDGTVTPFAIPVGKVFVVTSLSVVGGTGSPPATPGNPVQIQLLVGNNGIAVRNVDVGPTASISIDNITMPTGIVVRSGTSLCIQGIDLLAAAVGVSGTVNGYLADDL